MRKQRTIYHNDARHYHLWLHDPPIRLKDAQRPVDDVAGTGVDTFSYCVERGDGAFYPTKVGLLFGTDKQPFSSSITWHAWEAFRSLSDDGYDPLQILIDRAHEKGMEFWADLRLAQYGGMDPKFAVENGGRYFAETGVREHFSAMSRELVVDYNSDGLELDFTIANGTHHSYLRPEDVEQYTSVITEWVKSVSEMVKRFSGPQCAIGARVYPLEETNLRQGLDVREWLANGILDFVVPMQYEYNSLDPNMPFDWLIEAAHLNQASVYGMLQPYVPVQEVSLQKDNRHHAPQDMMRATAASYWDRGVDGLYTWFMRWPHGSDERTLLTDISDPDLISEKDKRFFVLRRSQDPGSASYGAGLPIEIPHADSKPRAVSIYVADDVRATPGNRVKSVKLIVSTTNMVGLDGFEVMLNGESVLGETCTRDFAHNTPHLAPRGLELTFELKSVVPIHGWNVVELSLNSRPKGFEGGMIVEGVELLVEYAPYPTSHRVAKE